MCTSYSDTSFGPRLTLSVTLVLSLLLCYAVSVTRPATLTVTLHAILIACRYVCHIQSATLTVVDLHRRCLRSSKAIYG